uniref:thioredoxin-disulfide reductase (NADPH) n=1 Tax=Haptolina brevifila TaxID=156173 RepID=A0A7S2ISP4_9EUKA
MKSPPGKTLVVGGGYVALECAGFIHGVGYETKVMMRSVPLRGFDQQMAEHVVGHMERSGTAFIRGATPTSVELTESGRKMVRWEKVGEDGRVTSEMEEFDTVMLAVGRDPFTHKVGLDKAGVHVNANGKLPVSHEQSNVDHIYAIGDIIDGAALNPPSSLTELTPVAIQAGKLLAARLFGGGSIEMDYSMVPTTVYTPLEYGCVGLAEEDAIAKYGAENVEVYHQYFKPLEWRIVQEGTKADHPCYAKLIVHTADSERIIGLHICGPHAGEMMQGFALAIRLGATKDDLDATVGIHPTTVETLTTMSVTKRSGESAESTGC